MKHAGKDVRESGNVTKTYFLVWEDQTRVKCTSFAQHVSVIFLVLVVGLESG
jgi:hypothetical protein